MIPKKTAASKRSPLPRAVDFTQPFHRDWTRLFHSGRHDMRRLKEAMLRIHLVDDGTVYFVRAGSHADLFGG